MKNYLIIYAVIFSVYSKGYAQTSFHIDLDQPVLFGHSLEGQGTKLFYRNDRKAFRVGELGFSRSTFWDVDSLGVGSFAAGQDVKATGEDAVAMGWRASASGSRAVSLGNSTNASGSSSVAFALDSEASGFASIAGGYSSEASGAYSTAFGEFTEATGRTSTSLGQRTQAAGDYSTAIGFGTKARSHFTTSLGRSTIAKGSASMVTGYNTQANGFGSLVTGVYNDTLVSAVTGFSPPDTWNDDMPLLIVGNGSSYDSPANALEVFYDGTTKIHGDLQIESESLNLRNLGTGNNEGIIWSEDQNPAFGIIYDGFGTGNNNRLHFREFLGTPADIMTIKGNGYIGIGEGDPKAPVHINDFMKLEPRSTPPSCLSNTDEGRIYYDSTLRKVRACVALRINNVSHGWVDLH